MRSPESTCDVGADNSKNGKSTRASRRRRPRRVGPSPRRRLPSSSLLRISRPPLRPRRPKGARVRGRRPPPPYARVAPAGVQPSGAPSPSHGAHPSPRRPGLASKAVRPRSAAAGRSLRPASRPTGAGPAPSRSVRVGGGRGAHGPGALHAPRAVCRVPGRSPAAPRGPPASAPPPAPHRGGATWNRVSARRSGLCFLVLSYCRRSRSARWTVGLAAVLPGPAVRPGVGDAVSKT